MVFGLEELKNRSFYTSLFAEFVGTLFLVLFGCGAVQGNVVQTSLAFAFAVATIVWNIGRVSGGHINPAVSFGFFVTRRISLVRFVLFVVAQLLGALAGAGILYGAVSSTAMGVVGITGLTEAQGFAVELLITFGLVWTVFATVDKRRTDLAGSAPLSIGLSIGLGHLFAVPLTGAGMNPARAFGPAIIYNSINAHWVYWIGPLIGGAAAALIYDIFFAVNASPEKFKGMFSLSFNDDNFDSNGRAAAGTSNGSVEPDPEAGATEMQDTVVKDDENKS